MSTVREVPGEELWLPVAGYESHYVVSNHGRVRRISFTQRTDCKLLGAATSHGYRSAALTVGGVTVQRYIHRLVATAFLPNPTKLPYVNHIDGDGRNNHLSNLEWATPRQNLLHRSRILLKEVGEAHHAAKLRRTDIYSIRQLIASGSGDGVIGKRFGVSRGTIRAVRNGRTWGHVQPVST